MTTIQTGDIIATDDLGYGTVIANLDDEDLLVLFPAPANLMDFDTTCRLIEAYR